MALLWTCNGSSVKPQSVVLPVWRQGCRPLCHAHRTRCQVAEPTAKPATEDSGTAGMVSNFISAAQGRPGVYDFTRAQFVRDLIALEGEEAECVPEWAAASIEAGADTDGAAGTSSEQSDVGSCSDDEVQGYRTADRVALLRVPVLSGASIASYDQGALFSMDVEPSLPASILAQSLGAAQASTSSSVDASGCDATATTMLSSTSSSAGIVAVGPITSNAVQPLSGSKRRNKKRSKLVVAKVSNYRCEETGQVDTYKFASTTNEYETFTRFPEAMHHKNLVQVLGWSKTAASISVLSEFCDGGDLQQLASSRAAAARDASSSSSSDEDEQDLQGRQVQVGMSEQQVKVVLQDMLAGLASMHTHGLTHGDIKPANVFISLKSQAASEPFRVGVETQEAPLPATTAASELAAHPGQKAAQPVVEERIGGWDCASQLQGMTFKIGDFGTVRDKDRKHLHYFVQGFGYTLEYASPEALRHGTSRSGPASDIWSIGVVIVELLLGRTPGFATTMKDLADPSQHGAREKWLRQHPPAEHALAELARGGVAVSAQMAQIIKETLQVRPQDRTTDACMLLQLPWFTGKEMVDEKEHPSALFSLDSFMPSLMPWLA